LLKNNDIFADEGAAALALNNLLSEDGNSQLPNFNLRRPQFIENRFKQEVVCKYYDSIKDDFFSFNGILLFKDKDVLSFIAERPVEREMPVFIKHKTPLKNSNQDSLDEGTHAQVISCKKAGEKNGKSCYQIIIQYF